MKVKTLPERLKILKVLISGANSPCALPLLFSIAKGYIFGDDKELIIVIYGFTKHLIRHAKALEAELSMGGFKLLIGKLKDREQNNYIIKLTFFKSLF